MSPLSFLFPFGRGRPSLRAFLGDQTGKLMSIEASVARIEAQNAVIAEVLVGVFQTQRTHTDMLKALADAAPQAMDTTELDASIAATDAVLAKLAPATTSSTAANASGAAAPEPDPATGTAAATTEPAQQSDPQTDAPASGAANAA